MEYEATKIFFAFLCIVMIAGSIGAYAIAMNDDFFRIIAALVFVVLFSMLCMYIAYTIGDL